MLQGVFSERERARIYTFQPDKMRLDEPDSGIWEGAYSLYSWNGSNYLELHLTETQNFTEYRRSYRVEVLSTEGDSSEAPSVLLLHPVRLLQGEEVNDTSQSVIRLEREELPEVQGSSLETQE